MLNSLKIDEDAEYSNYLKRKSKLKFWKESNCPSVQINQEFPANDSEPQLRESFFLDKELKGEYAKLHKRVGKDYNRRKIGKLFEKDFEDSDMSIDYDLMPYPGWNKSELKKISEILKSSDTLSELKENLKSTKGLEINKTKIKLKDDLKAILRMIRDLDI